MGSLQDLPHVDMMTPITKFAATVPDTARAADMVSMAFRECYHGAPGPSFLEIPRDVLDAKVPVSRARVPRQGAYRASTRSAGDPEAIEKLADLLVHAEKPAILLGSQVWTTRGTEAAIELVRALNVPAYMNGAGRGTLAPGDPHHFQLSRRYAFSNADVIVIVGTPSTSAWATASASPRRDGRTDRPRLPHGRQEPRHRPRYRRRRGTGAEVGDRGGLRTGERRRVPAQGVAGRAAGGRADRAGEAAAATALRRLPIHPYRLVSEINDFLTEDSIYIGDGGDIVTFSGQVVQPKSPGHWMDPGPLGTLGVGVPFVLAAKQARPDKEVVALFGDGAFSSPAGTSRPSSATTSPSSASSATTPR
ncbi:hypothetical protein SHKM778_35270 [Streptomyces sp. KM77-8]|uniref:Uncharacterized protein n=1 Tax=Streptomyces haneummycinicus TaxID=3074435 RepID=A0AAT9HI96_9ACTN